MTSYGPPEHAEFPLPAIDIPDEFRERLHPWIAGFIGLTPPEANERLAERWGSIERPTLKALRETFSKFNVEAIVDQEPGGLIYATRPGVGDMIGDSFLLPGPMERSAISQYLEPAGLDRNVAVCEFLSHFGGWAEDTNGCGQFVYGDPPWRRMTDSWNGSIQSFDEWENALLLFYDRGGSVLLVRKDGKVGWWVAAESLIRPEAEDFDEFLLKFNAHRQNAWPYDPYGAP